MTITQAISRADELRLNTISHDQKVEWVTGIDRQLAERLDHKIPEYNWPAEDDTLLLPAPHDWVYVVYLCVQIDYYNNETTLYANDKAVYDAALNEALGWWRRNHCPDDSGNVQVM